MLAIHTIDSMTGKPVKLEDANIVVITDGHGAGIEIFTNRENEGFGIRGHYPEIKPGESKKNSRLSVLPLGNNQIEIKHSLVVSQHSR